MTQLPLPLIALMLSVAPAAATAPLSARAVSQAGLPQAERIKMVRDFTLHFEHQLGADEARRRVKARIEDLHERFGDKLESSDVTWNEYDADIRVKALSQTANAHIAITETAIDVRVHLPLLISPFADQIRGVLDKAGIATLQ